MFLYRRHQPNKIYHQMITFSVCHTFWDNSPPSCLSFVFKAFQYFLALGLALNISITSIIEKYQISFSSSQIRRICTLGKYEDLHNNLKYTNHHL